MANSIGAFSANILARFNAAYNTAGQGNTSAATSTGDAIAKLKNAISDASSPSNAGNDAVILNLSAAAQQLLASLQSGGTQNSDAAQGDTQQGTTRNSLVQAINQQIANQPSLASYLGIGQDTTINGLNFQNGFGADSSGAADGVDAFGSISGAGGAIEQFQQWLSQPLQANLERAIERENESSPLNEAKTEDDKTKASDQTASDKSSADATNSTGDTSASGSSTAGSSGQASA